MDHSMDQRLPKMLMWGNSPGTHPAGVTTTVRPTKCSLLLSVPLPSGTQSLKDSLTGSSQSYWNPFHLAPLCPCPAAEVSSKSPLTSAVLDGVCVLPDQKKEGSAAMVHKRQVERPVPSIVTLLLFIIYHNCCFTVNCCASQERAWSTLPIWN